MKNVFWLIFVVGSFFAQISLNATENLDHIQKSVVQIKVFSQSFDPYSPWLASNLRSSTGTGFIIKDNKILTNAHVISNAVYIQIQRSSQTEWYKAKVLHIAHDCDLALLEALEPKFYVDSSQLEIGILPDLNSPVMVVGFPIGGDKISISRGIVSRKEQSTYAHSEIDSHLVIQVDAAINPGNSGGPAIQNNKVVGVAFQVATKGENIGYLIPPTVIKYFLDDILDNKYDGYVELGIRTINSFNQTYREYRKVPKEMNGVFVTRVFKGGSADGFLQKDDLLMEIDDLPIGKNGTVVLDRESRIDFVEIVDNKHASENIKFKIFRNGKTDIINFPAKKMKEFEYQRLKYDVPIDYFMIGGLLFQEISRDLLNAWSKTKETRGGSQFLYRFYYFVEDNLSKEVDADVILYRKLDHQINASSDYFMNFVLESVNGIKIKNLIHFKQVYKDLNTEYAVFKFRDIPSPLILKRSEVEKADLEIIQLYRIEE